MEEIFIALVPTEFSRIKIQTTVFLKEGKTYVNSVNIIYEGKILEKITTEVITDHLSVVLILEDQDKALILHIQENLTQLSHLTLQIHTLLIEEMIEAQELKEVSVVVKEAKEENLVEKKENLTEKEKTSVVKEENSNLEETSEEVILKVETKTLVKKEEVLVVVSEIEDLETPVGVEDSVILVAV